MKERRFQVRKALIVHSPHSGRSSLLTQAIACLQQEGISPVGMLAISDLDGLPEQGNHWAASGIDIVVAAGGDGLLGGVISHIAESTLPLGILPLGTSNDVARSLQISLDLQQAARTIAYGRIETIDIGVAEFTSTPQQKQRYFAHALTVGLNVEFARLATSIATRQRYGRFTYPLTALEILKNHIALDVELHFEELVIQSGESQPAGMNSSLQCRALQVTVINAPIFGGAWQLAIPGASLQNHLIDILVIEELDREELYTAITRFFHRQEQQPSDLDLWHARHPLLHTAELTGIPGLHHRRARGVTITTNNDPQDITLDGEIRGQTPTYVHIAKQRLQVMVPEQIDGAHHQGDTTP